MLHLTQRTAPSGGYSPAGLHHGGCAVATLSEQQVLALPAAERNKLSLADTGLQLMRALLAAAPAGSGHP